MTFQLGKGSRAELQGVHPRLIDVVERAIAISKVDFGVHDGLRTMEEQRRYVQSGVSQTMASLHRQQADGFGHAVDLVPYINGKLRWEWPPIYAIAAAMRTALDQHNAEVKAKSPLRLRWGGCWRDLATIPADPAAMERAVADYGAAQRKAGRKAFTDGPHFEILP
jgi:peptidoglycan L-alanyl-D-glutamate endopeptidase CwlK